MRTTRSMTKKDLEKSEGNTSGHTNLKQTGTANQHSKSSVKGDQPGETIESSLSPGSNLTANMSGRNKNQDTPSKQAKGKSSPLTLETLAELIKENGSKMGEIQVEMGQLKTSVETWQEKTDNRLDALERANTEFSTNINENTRLVSSASDSNASLKLEIAELRKENKLILEQLALTQAVVIKNGRESNELGREIKKLNIRFGKVAEPLTPPPTGQAPGFKPREDTKQVIVDFIGKHGLHPGKTPMQISQMIEVAYRTGSVEQNRVRHILVKFHRLDDRRTIMVNGKKKERENQLDGAFLQDDLTADDMSKKRRSHAYMHKMKINEKRPTFIGGRVKTLDGFVKEREVIKYNTDNGIEDTRKKEITADLLTLNIKALGLLPDKKSSASPCDWSRGRWRKCR